MKRTSFIRIAGVAGMFGAALWFVALLIEYRFGLFPPGSGALFTANQTMFFVAQLCYLTTIAGLMRAGAGGGWFGKISLGLLFVGWAALAVALGLSLFSDASVADALIPIGGIASTLGGLLTGIAVAVVGRLRGWHRFSPLVQGTYQLFVIFLPAIFIDGRGPTQLTESLWTGTWFLIGLALFASATSERRPPTQPKVEKMSAETSGSETARADLIESPYPRGVPSRGGGPRPFGGGHDRAATSEADRAQGQGSPESPGRWFSGRGAGLSAAADVASGQDPTNV